MKIKTYLYIMLGLLLFCTLQAQENRITLIEYYDYECPHCRAMSSVLTQLQWQYPTLTINYKATPLLNAASKEVAALSLASTALGDKDELHNALMALTHAPSIAEAVQLAIQTTGVAPAVLLNTAATTSTVEQLHDNIIAASRYTINGVIPLPILVLKMGDTTDKQFVLYGEQSFALLSAAIAQLQQDMALASDGQE